MRLTDPSAVPSAGRAWLRIYPRAWRERYEDELHEVLGLRRLTIRSRVDLARGALDAHVHPLTQPAPPTVASLIAGMAWIVAGLASSLQPLMPDWPGFLLETIPLGVVGAVASARTVAQTARRSGLAAPHGTTAALVVALVGHALWVVALVAAAVGGPYGAITGATGALAAIGIVLVGAVRARAEDHPAAELLLIVGAAMLIPSPAAWILAGGGWVALAVAGLRPVVPLRRA